MQLEIPKQLFDPNVFNAWMVLFLNLLERPVLVEGQPLDPDARKSWGVVESQEMDCAYLKPSMY
jgi:hypothetical protein